MNVELMESRLAQRPTSPLFARLASQYLERGDPEKAIQLCRGGLEHFPGYASAHVVLARCLAAEGDYRSALQELRHARELTTGAGLLGRLQDDWEARSVAAESAAAPAPDVALETESPEIPEAVGPQEEVALDAEPVIVREVEEQAPEPPLPAAAPPPNESVVEASPVLIPQAERSAPEPQARPEAATERRAEAPPEQEAEESDRIVSRTLAEIYARQGEYLEAIITYQLLKRQRPERANDFDARIRELEIMLQEKLAG
jgi:tetratricopeptide (TPR) repeat protein